MDAEFLGVFEGGLVVVDGEGALAFAALALVGFLEVFVLGDGGEGAAALAFEGGFVDFGADVGGFSDDSLDRDEGVDVVGADCSDVCYFWEVVDADVGLAEADVDGEVVEAEGFLGVVFELVGLGEVVVSDVWVESVEVVPVDVEGAFCWVVLGELGDGVVVVVPVELLEFVDELGVFYRCHSHMGIGSMIK